MYFYLLATDYVEKINHSFCLEIYSKTGIYVKHQ